VHSQLRQRPDLTIVFFSVALSIAVPDLVVYNDSYLPTRAYIQQTASCCFSVLHQLCSIGQQVPAAVFQLLVDALVCSCLDYCNSILAGPVANLPVSSSVSSQVKMLQHGLSLGFGGMIASLMHLPVSIGYECLSKS